MAEQNSFTPDAIAHLLGIDVAEVDQLVKDRVFARLPTGKLRVVDTVRAYVRHLREHYERKRSHPTQAELAVHLDCSQTNMTQLLTGLGLVARTSTLDEVRIAYIRRLRAQASGHYTSKGLNLADERAGLAREQKHIARIKKQQTLGEWVPLANVTHALARTTSQMASVFDGIPGMLKQRSAKLTGDDILAVRSELTRARGLLFEVGVNAIRDAAYEATDYAAEYDTTDDVAPVPDPD